VRERGRERGTHHVVERYDREGLINLPEVDVVDRQPVPLQQPRNLDTSKKRLC
jgi:hypothetical protein